MKSTAKQSVVLVLALVGVMTVLARAQDDFEKKGAPPFKTAPGVLGVLQKSSYALGMLRRVVPSTHGVTGLLLIGNGTMAEPQRGGTWAEYKVPRVQLEMTYFPLRQGVNVSPGARWDYTLVDSSGKTQRRIQVVAGNAAWDEATPGGVATPMMETATYRLAQNWLSPHGFLWACLTADGKGVAEGVTMGEEGGKTVIMFPVNGVPAKATLDGMNRPEKIEVRLKHPILGDTSVEFDYSDYRDIEYGYDVMFPGHIAEKIGGHTALDLTVTEFHTNPYTVFPLPPNVAKEK
jgi:hypothetical protein